MSVNKQKTEILIFLMTFPHDRIAFGAVLKLARLVKSILETKKM